MRIFIVGHFVNAISLTSLDDNIKKHGRNVLSFLCYFDVFLLEVVRTLYMIFC